MKTYAHVIRVAWMIIIVSTILLSACAGSIKPVITPTESFSKELTLYNWADYMPQSVIDKFTQEYGVKINYVVYDSQEEAAANIRAGKEYDVVVLPTELIPGLIQDGSLAKIDYRNVQNFKNISPNFRGLSFDPENQYSIPFHWGTTGLLYRTDLVKKPITHWSDLWEPEFAGKVAIWPVERDVIPFTLKALGYPANSEDPAQLQVVLEKLLELRKNSFLLSMDLSSIIPTLAEGKAVIGYGWAYDALSIEDQPIAYIIPEEGSSLWSEHFTIPANSKNKRTAELFLDFVLRPEISAEIVNESYYPMANDAATPFINPEILGNKLIYPPIEVIQNSEIILPLSEAGQKLYDEIWKQFMEAGNPPE